MWLGLCRTLLILAVFNRFVTSEEEEVTCPSDTFRCKEETSPGSHCIPKNWLCDSDEDCPGGEDEEANCSIPTCPSNQFQCLRGAARCVPQGWACDGENDCDDGSDEHASTCSFIDRFKCGPNLYQCPGTRNCIHYDLVCDGKVDCVEDRADEGPHCRNTGCKDKPNCKYCRETIKGPQCYCDDHHVIDPATLACVDLIECNYDGFCDQKCTNTPDSYSCSCVDGYSKNSDEATDGSCKVDGMTSLIYANTNNIEQVTMDGSKVLATYSVNGSKIETLDFDIRNNSVCWINFVKSNKSTMQCAKLSDPSKTWTLMTHHKLSSVEHVARDWIGDNWYFADDVKENIFLCRGDGKHCIDVITIGIKRPKSIVIDPTRGLLFYADWSMNAKIERANMDGTNQRDLVIKKIVHPNGLALDYANKHVYWGDSFLDFIERVDYEGHNRRVIAQGVNVDHVYGITILGNYLYVTNHHNNSIVKVHRYHPEDIQQISQHPLIKPSDIQVIHAVRQPSVPVNVCEEKKCDHICVPVPHNSNEDKIVASCMCRAGYTLVNKTACQKNNDNTFLLYANAQQGSVQGISMDTNKSEHVIEPIINLNRPIAITFDARTNFVYYSDVSLLRIGRRNAFTDEEPEVFMDAGVTSSEGLALDWIGRNLYWTDDGHKTINVVRLDNITIRYTVVSNLNHPKAIVLDPNQGYMYWTDWVLKPSEIKSKIEKSYMDGSKRTTLVETQIQWPNSLTMDYKTNTIYWTDAYYDRIESISTSGDNRKIIVPFQELHHPYGIAVYNHNIFWTESLSGQVMRLNTTTNKTDIIRTDSSPIFDLKLYDPELQTTVGEKACTTQNGGCSEICITVPDGHVCKCSIARKLKDDGVSCEDNPDYMPPAPCNVEREFLCKDGSCINKLWLCDKDIDCLDGSDEDDSKTGVCGNQTCASNMFMCDDKSCIQQPLRCDREHDCPNGEDELNCENRTCPVNYTSCGSSSRCIPAAWICDKEADCPDGSDETPSRCDTADCQQDQFQCAYGHCIPYLYRCDNEYDCPDHSDEMDCNNWCDPHLEFRCSDKSRCLKKSLVCDGEANCDDKSDEQNCDEMEKPICNDKDFQCDNGDCVPGVWRCDGDKDCTDQSDEANCSEDKKRECHYKEFECEDKLRCIPSSWRCDGDYDCDDQSDERPCTKECEYPKFSCPNSDVCFPPEKYCDIKHDCSDGSDESRLCNMNLCDKHECSHTCHPAPFGYVCSCPTHKKIKADNKTCEEVDSCSKWGICSQKCIQVPNSHRHQCVCTEGYILQDDNYSCKPIEPEPVYLIYSNRHEMRRVDLGQMTYVSLVAGLRNTIAIDYYYKKQMVFWTDVIDDKIYSGKMLLNISKLRVPPEALTDIKPIINVGLATTEGLAVDWIGEKIYWVESNLDQIEVADLEGKLRRTLVAGNMTSPRAIVLDPRYGALFWSDWDGKAPRIETCSMSGKNRKVLFDVHSNFYQGGWPNGIALDYEVNRLYWVDARSDSLHSITYEGTDHRLILKSHEVLAQPFSVSVFEHYVYWTDWRTNSLFRANKFNGSSVTEVQKTFTQPFDLHVYHPRRQPDTYNPCAENNGGCSHLCLIGSPKTKGGTTTADCQCPHRMKLNDDQHSCDKDNKFLIFVKKNEIRGVDLARGIYNVIPSITVRFVDNASTPTTAIDYDIQEQRLYWTDVSRNVINSAYLNGSGVETIIDSGLSDPKGFAIDYLSRNMYFSSYNKVEKSSTISVSKLNGAFRTEIITKDLGNLNSLAIHPKQGLMFWSDVGSSKHKIIRANMDGSNPSVLVADAFKPVSLSVDIKGNTLYWISQGQNNINSCDFDGKCEKFNVDFNNMTLMSMAVFEDKIYVFGSKAASSDIIKVTIKTKKKVVMKNIAPDITAMQIYNDDRGKDGINSCSKNNGGCTQLCLPTHKNRICKCTAGFQIASDKKSCHGITSFMLYATESEIKGFSLKYASQVALASISKISLASAIHFNAEEDYIYWVDSNARHVSRIKRDLTHREEIINEGLNGIEGLAVDWIANNIYWTDKSHNTIEVAKTDGTNRYVILHEGLDDPRSIVVHPVLGKLYFIDLGKHPVIFEAKLDGSELKPLINTDIARPSGLTIDYEEDMLYWCDQETDQINTYNLINDERKTLITDLTDCVSVSVFKEHIYWADAFEGNGSIKRAKKVDGSDIQFIRKDLSNKIKDIKIFDKERQKGTNICERNQYKCAELCLYKGDEQAACICSYGKLQKDGRNCEEYTDFLMFSEVTAIGSAHMINNTNINPPFDLITNDTVMKNVIGIAYDYKHQRLYYSDIQRGDIQTVFFNGTGHQIVMKSVGSAEGLVYDSTQNDLYLTSYTNSSINRIRLGNNPDFKNLQIQTLIQLSDKDHPRAIALHSCQSRIFWTNWNNENPRIQRSFLNGFQAESIITERIETPNGLAIDHKAEKLYWSDARLDKIERCDLDGTNRIVIVTSIPQHSFGLAVYGNYIYWTDWMLRAVLRANKYDGSEITWLKKNIKRQPMGIVAIAEDADNCTLNPCYKNMYGCEGECITTEKGLAKCTCPKGKFLLHDGRRCASEKNLNCSMTDYVCENGKMCVAIEKTCNEIPDCADFSDESEEYCKNRPCPSDYSRCNNSRCVYLDKLCNGINDCGDNSDERECPCPDDEFQCTNGMCISRKYRCDRDSDCADHSDEIGCNLNCSDVEMDGEKVSGLVSCNTTSPCIFPIWICDGTNDCWDNNDEKNCNNTSEEHCPENSFRCKSGSCIPPQWRCDKDFDCADVSDEADCKYTCHENEQFACNDSTCLPKTWQCDGHPDCPDGSDEHPGCGERSCKPDEFRCSTGKCIPMAWKCDGDSDCEHEDDESILQNCSPVLCEENEFQCLNRKCIPNTFFCDRDDDCGDNSDEKLCFYPTCGPNEFKCLERGMCIDTKDRCNGYFDCPDHSDEANCTAPVSCGGDETQFLCNNDICIAGSLVCNGNNDCGDGSDEPINCGYDECENSHLCSHTCIDKPIGYKCTCREGYSLREDNKTCQDINECNTTFPCSHYCQNYVGSYVCSCAKGYKLTEDRRNCKDDTRPVLIVSNRYYIRNVSLPVGNSSILNDNLTNAVAIDLDWKDQFIYWSDITSRVSSINRMRVPDGGKASKIEVLHTSTVRNPDGLAVDWVGRNLYWCDKTTDTIEVSLLDGRYRRVLLREGLQEPRGLEVFPSKGVLFYTDWGDNHHIGRMWMDGGKRETIVKDNLGWPNALTIDYITEKIIWADGSLDYIAMANLDGSGRRIIVGDSVRVPHVFALATFENFIYWTDWEHMGIFYAHKFNGTDVKLLTNMVHKPMGLQIYHPLKQVELDANPCENNECSHLCLLRPKNGDLNQLEAVCSCPENFHLSKDNKICISNCTSAQFLCEKSSKCIPFWWKCDGHVDCSDGSDEPPNCPHYYCLITGFFQCDTANSSNQCFPPSMICDGKENCLDKSDEKNCESFPCLDHHFKCRADNKCIPDIQKCDRNNTCSDGEDERDCPQVSCNDNQFQCGNGKCVPYVWKCDNDDDCGDWSDEPTNCTLTECRKDHIKCKNNGRCIPEAWTCDGDRDCGEDDDTDEDYGSCQDRTCDPTYLHCKNGHCIPGRWECDGYDDCRDGSDELHCAPRNCSESEWRCNIGKCISKKLRCNKEINCEDGSDEVNCHNITCSDDEFLCQNIKHCIPSTWKCDGDTDCADGTDEWNCARNCSEHEFKCNNSICQSALWKCDGDDDCGDKSDEDPEMCKDHMCSPGRFRCKTNHVCIWYNMVCDGKNDCPDGEDEGDLCDDRDTCKDTDFRCKGTKSKQCISVDKLCDGHSDCKDGSDEIDKFCKSLNCSLHNGNCEHHCHQKNASVVCSCKEGFMLDTDGFSCIRHNPCKEFGKCSQLCKSEEDLKHVCYCDTGFMKMASSCIAEGEPPTLLLAEEGKVIRTSLPNQNNISKVTLLKQSQDQINNHIVAMDIDVTGSDWLAFTVTLTRNHAWIVQSIKIPQKITAKRVRRDASDINRLFTSFADIRGLTADWVSKRIYWTEGATRSIKVAKYDGTRNISIVVHDLTDPQDIVVHPNNRQIFWSDQGVMPKIERSNLDGTNRTVLVDTDIIWPNGLAVDYYNDRLYWTDTKKYTIESTDLDGHDRRLIQTLDAADPPYKLEVFENFIYVLTYKNFTVLRLHKFGSQRQKLKKLYLSSEKIRELVIVQEHKQKNSIPNSCKGSPCAETQMCFNDWSDEGYSCRCPDNAVFDDKKCNFIPNKNECTAGYCKNDGNCSKNLHSKLKCSCSPLFGGERCEIDKCHNLCIIGDCVESDTQSGEVMCKCHEGYYGDKCDKYKCTDYCHNSGKCIIKDGKPYCFCSSVFHGERCEKKLDEDNKCPYCNNNASCHQQHNGYIQCDCNLGFKGKHCDQCNELHCYNGGVCHRHANNTAYCSCPPGYEQFQNCGHSDCVEICKSNSIDKGICNCPCEGVGCSCNEYDCQLGNCSLVNNEPVCKCHDIYDGNHCQLCKCKDNGVCEFNKEGQPVCSCNAGKTGTLCEENIIQAPNTSSIISYPLTIVIPIIVSFIIIILIIIIIVCRKQKRWQQYRHKRMQEPRNLDVNNPIYLQNDEDIEDIEPLESSPIYTGNKNTNFANPMYDMYNGESMSMLLQSQENDSNQILDDGLTVRYYSNGELSTNNNTTSKA